MTIPSPFATLYIINSGNFSTQSALDLGTWLISVQNAHKGKIVIIMSHFPLHTLKSDVSTAAQLAIFDTLNNHGNCQNTAEPLDIVFIWGHTHGLWTDGKTSYDTKIKMDARPSVATTANHYMLEDDNLANYNSTVHNLNTKKPLWFTYVNAGYVSSPDNINPSAFTGFMTAVYPVYNVPNYGDKAVFTVSRFAADGTHQDLTEFRVDPYRFYW